MRLLIAIWWAEQIGAIDQQLYDLQGGLNSHIFRQSLMQQRLKSGMQYN